MWFYLEVYRTQCPLTIGLVITLLITLRTGLIPVIPFAILFFSPVVTKPYEPPHKIPVRLSLRLVIQLL